MKLRLLPVVLSVIISAGVLFGGWFAYTSFAMENPLSDIISKVPGVTSSTMKLDKDRVDIEVSLQADANLRTVVERINKDGASIIGKRTVNIQIKDNPSEKLNEWWSKALFEVAQAMETKHYADIPTTLQKYASDIPNMKVESEMDQTYVYIRLTDGDATKFIMLPRSTQMGVWPNE
ncbi:hypothetical protein P5G65_25745 [Paenibacillus chondroitinus]|uniref:Uncharacterized protein n=1 Tax=Paenibacillus chondroitinus TaxID=59842 RepID=A0ABU6DKH3_9BACL|nr:MULTISPECIES: hypothetical protein [Paenibacillus]MCY9657237.1 hypothetical protein [Paenibacillus anseongense]MEB4797312.1 hypothetical protein [Paenibacillus chondroitinus]